MRKEYKKFGDVYDNMSLDGKCYFKEEGHIYCLPENPSLCFDSVTGIIETYAEEFDKQKVAERCSASSNSKYYKREVDDILQEWEDKANTGTLLHSYGEAKLNFELGGLNAGKEGKALQQEMEELRKIIIKRDGETRLEFVDEIVQVLKKKGYQLAITELLVYSELLRLAGQLDILLKRPSVAQGKFQIYDWKFLTEEIKKKSFYNPYKRTYKLMQGPFKYLHDTNWIHYSIQLAIYQTLTGDPGAIDEKVLVVVNKDKWEFVPCYPMRVGWSNGELFAVYELWNGKWYDSRDNSITKAKPKIVGL